MKATGILFLLAALCIAGFSFGSGHRATAKPSTKNIGDTLMMQPGDTIDIENFPLPDASVERLFYLQRDPNTNTILYRLNLNDDGSLNKDEPVHALWKLYSKQEQEVELTFIQRKFAYGVNTKHLGHGKYDIRIVSYKKIPFTLMKGTDGKYHIFVTILKRQAILNRVFIRINGGSLWAPNVVYMELKGIDTETGKEIAERLKP